MYSITKSPCLIRAKKETDPGNKYGTPEAGNRNNWTCHFYSKVNKGGISRRKQHLVGGFRSTAKCPTCMEHLREEIRSFMINKAEL